VTDINALVNFSFEFAISKHNFGIVKFKMTYTIILMTCIIPLFLIYSFIAGKKLQIKLVLNKKLIVLEELLEELSLEMNNQNLLVRNSNNEIRILKYQENELWGMKVIFDENIYEENEKLFILSLNKFKLKCIYNSNEYKIFDFGSNIIGVSLFVNFVFTDILKIQSTTKFDFIFEKKRLEILRFC
jgi:hypothetical protein